MNKCIQCGKTEREQAKGCNVITCEHQFRHLTFEERQKLLFKPINFKNSVGDIKIIKSNKITFDLLEKFRNKCGVWYCRYVSDKLLKQLKERLSDEEYVELSIAHNHYLIGEGSQEQYDVINKLKNLYK